MTGLAVAGAQFRLKPQDRLVLQQRFLPWALRAGNNCHDLMTIYYEHHLEVRDFVGGSGDSHAFNMTLATSTKKKGSETTTKITVQ
jgi:hypothetical protein